MKKSVLFVFVLLCVSASSVAKDKNLKLHYRFEGTSADKVVDASGNGYDATLKNRAYVDEMGSYKILNLGFSNGYVDMGEKTGELIQSLRDFSVAVYVCIDNATSLHANGNFIWAFSNSSQLLDEANGCLFLGAKSQNYSISKTNYTQEQTVSLEKAMDKGVWKHLVYTQKGTTGSIYIDGVLQKEGTIDLEPAVLGRTAFNFIGRSPYQGDVYPKMLAADFRVYDKALSQKEIRTLSKDLAGLQTAYVEYAQRPVKHLATGNPLFTHKYTADPAALVHRDTFYLYAGQDTGDGRGYNIPNWLVFSTQDMETWYEHPVPLRTSDFSWAVGNSSWASQVIERNGKFYWYVSTEHKTVRGKAIGVAVSDSPTGPFTDARGTALVTNDMTMDCTRISWDDIDPTVWIDDDGQAYLFWGNTCCYYAKLKDNMIELDGDILKVDIPYFTEAPWIHKRGDWYYLSYAAWFPEKICYAMSKSIQGPWEYKGILNEIAGNSNTNHQAILEYKGQWYFVYHNGAIQTQGGSYLRSVCIDPLYYNEDGTIRKIQMTSEGVVPIQ